VATVTSTLASKGLKLVALVNNAGVQKDMPVELQPPADNRFNFEVNVFGLFDVTHAFLPVLRATGPGARIVNVGSMSGLLAAPGSASYTGSKYAVEGITDSLRLELGDLGISVSLLQPGYVQSQMGVKAHESSAKSYGVTSEEYERYRRTVFDGFYVKDRSQSTDGTASTPATSTTPAIVDAIQSARPKTRYAVAFIDDFPAWLLVSLKAVLPDRVMDFLTLEL
jgi:short-subunit dehydrogenase